MLDREEIDGLFLRSEYDYTGQTERRHTLMSQPKVRVHHTSFHHLTPDLIAIVCRTGFPNVLSSKLTEPEGNTVLWVQSRIMGAWMSHYEISWPGGKASPGRSNSQAGGGESRPRSRAGLSRSRRRDIS